MGNLYTGAMGMISFQNKLEVVGNNIANARTNGFKKDTETFKVFEETFMNILSNDQRGSIGKYQHQVHMDEVHTSMAQGGLIQTDRNFDFALRDTAENETNFFTVERNGEEFLTKDGAFQVDSAGYLSMNDGSFVLNEQGQRIQMPENARPTINRIGELVDQNTGQLIGALDIQRISEDNYNLLEKAGNNKFKVISTEDFVASYGPLNELVANYDNNLSLKRLFPNRDTVVQIANQGEIAVLAPATQYDLMTGVLEQSNVDLPQEMTDLILAQRGFQASAKVLQVMDKVNEKDANQIGI